MKISDWLTNVHVWLEGWITMANGYVKFLTCFRQYLVILNFQIKQINRHDCNTD